jgi:hypothetical protein
MCKQLFLKPEKQKSDSIMRTKQMIYVMAFYGKTNVNLIISFFLLSFWGFSQRKSIKGMFFVF